jgi:hypothetical protein
MTQDHDNPWLDPLLSQQIHHEPADFHFEKWLQTHPREVRLLERGFGDAGRSKTTNTHPIWRYIMESKMTRYSAAAVVVLAAAVVLVNPPGISNHGGVALAAVQEKVAQVDTAVLRGQKVFSAVDEPNASLTFDTVKYISRQHGYAEEGRRNGVLMYRVVLNRTDNQCLMVFPLWKKCVKRPCTEGQIKLMENLTPNGVIEVFLESDYKNLGPAVIDGMNAEGFAMQNVKSLKDVLPKYLFDVQEGKGTVWVRTDDLLPIRLEADLLIGKSLATLLMDVHLHKTAVLDSYNVDLSKDLFNTDLPEGYTELKLTDFLPAKLSLAGLGALPAGCIVWRKTRHRRAARNSAA